MSEQLSETNEDEYLNQHPDAIEDAEKAHLMALAGNELESDSAELRLSTMGKLALGTARERQDVRKGPEPYAYIPGERIPGGKRTETEGEVEIPDVISKLESNNNRADTQYRLVGEAYDKLKQTKR